MQFCSCTRKETSEPADVFVCDMYSVTFTYPLMTTAFPAAGHAIHLNELEVPVELSSIPWYWLLMKYGLSGLYGRLVFAQSYLFP